jgi:hypothetical protein
MASRYYNPRLAQVVGAAQSTPYVSLTPAIEKGQMAFERGQAKKLKQQALELEKKKLEAEAFKNEEKRIDDVLYTVFKNKETASNKIDYAPTQIKGLTATLLDTATKNYGKIEALIKDGKISRGEALTLQDEQVNNLIKKANGLLDNYDELIENIDNLEPSSINSSQDLKLSRKLIAGEYIVNMGPDGEYYADIIDDDNKTVINSVPLSELNKPNYIPVDTEAFAATLDTLNTAMEKAAKVGKNEDIAGMEIDNALRNLKFTPEQTLSIAFDYLGKEMPEYVDRSKYLDKNGDIDINKFKGIIDAEGDGNEDEDLLAWTRKQLKEIALKSYNAYQDQYKKDLDPDDIKLTSTQRLKQKETKERIDSVKKALPNLSLPRDNKGNIDIDNSVFSRELAKYNLIPDIAGSYTSENGGKIIKVKSNFTNDALPISSNMSELEIKRAILQLSGATLEEVNQAYPIQQLPSSNPRDYSQYIKQ